MNSHPTLKMVTDRIEELESIFLKSQLMDFERINKLERCVRLILAVDREPNSSLDIVDLTSKTREQLEESLRSC